MDVQVDDRRQWITDDARLSRGGLRQRWRGQDCPGVDQVLSGQVKRLTAYLATTPLIALQGAEAKRRATVLGVVRLAPDVSRH